LQIPELVVYSGDYVKQDKEGYIYYVGRKDTMIKTSGFRVSPTEIEESFHNSGQVQDVIALGVPDQEKGESIRVIAVLQPDANITREALLRLVSKDLPSYMIPKELELRKTLPKNPNGKIDRAVIQREELGKRL
jgi:acyl-coenzyme A synthetase/AMP-(fatty) acid ligase